jgi:hypothetical protein
MNSSQHAPLIESASSNVIAWHTDKKQKGKRALKKAPFPF